MAMTKEHPLGEPTPAGRMQEALSVADDMALCIERLRNKLLGERPVVSDTSQVPTSFFEGRDGRMNALAAHADGFLTAAQRAANAIREIEEALDVKDTGVIGSANAQSTRMVGGARHD